MPGMRARSLRGSWRAAARRSRRRDGVLAHPAEPPERLAVAGPLAVAVGPVHLEAGAVDPELASRGLLLTRSGYRPIVRRPDYDAAIETLGHFVGHLLRDERGVWNLFESRILVEAALARNAAAHAKREDVEELRRALERSHAAIGDPEAFYATDVAFHGVLYRIPRNPIYPALQKAYVAWLMDHWREMERSPDVDRLNHAGHVAVVEAIVARDPDEAEDALRRHLQVAWELVRGTFAARDGAPETDSAPSRERPSSKVGVDAGR